MNRDEEEFIPCVCCMMNQQEENGFCRKCNEDGCPADMEKWEAQQ